jgi:cytoskeletal protein CcmA (bactofilin family)
MGLFSRPKAPAPTEKNYEVFHSFVYAGSTVRGRFITDVSLRIDGLIEGDIEAGMAREPELGSQACVAVSALGHVVGDIHAFRVLVAGKVQGNIYATELVVVDTGAQIQGDITYSQIKMAQAVKHQGMLISRSNGVEAINL